MKARKLFTLTIVATLSAFVALACLPSNTPNSTAAPKSLLKSELSASTEITKNYEDEIETLLLKNRSNFNPFSEPTPEETELLQEATGDRMESATDAAENSDQSSSSEDASQLSALEDLISNVDAETDPLNVGQKLADSLNQAPRSTLTWIFDHEALFTEPKAQFLEKMLEYPYTTDNFKKIFASMHDVESSNPETKKTLAKKLYLKWYNSDPSDAQAFAQNSEENSNFKRVATLQERRKNLKAKLGWEPIYPHEEVMSRDPASIKVESELRSVLVDLESL